jgi:hypothetical protein
MAQSVQRLATGWTVRGSNPGGSEIFRTRPERLWGPPSLLYNGYRVFPGGKAAGAWRWPPTPHLATRLRVQLYLYSLPGPSWPVLEWTSSLPSQILSRFSFRSTVIHFGIPRRQAGRPNFRPKLRTTGRPPFLCTVNRGDERVRGLTTSLCCGR